MLKPFTVLEQHQQRSASLSSCCCATPGQKIVRKYRNAHRRRIQKREYRNLQKIVPSVAAKGKISKVTVIEEAIRYIDELHHALAKRLQTSQGLSVPMDCIEQLAQESFLAKKRGEKQSLGECPPQFQGMFPLHLLTTPSANSSPVTSQSMTSSSSSNLSNQRLRT